MDSKTPPIPELSLIIPVYGNADTLKELHHQISLVLSPMNIGYEIVFINDASPDQSLTVLSEMESQYSHIHLVNMKKNVGQHAAVLHGLRFSRGQCCIIMDADLQDPPSALPILLAKRSDAHQAIFAGRRGAYQSKKRMLTSRVYKTLLYYLTALPKDAGIFVLVERKLVNKLLAMPVIIPWINVMIGLSGDSLHSTPIQRQLRHEGQSAYSGFGRLKSAAKGIFCVVCYYLWKPQKSYLARLKQDPVAWTKLSKNIS